MGGNKGGGSRWGMMDFAYGIGGMTMFKKVVRMDDLKIRMQVPLR